MIPDAYGGRSRTRPRIVLPKLPPALPSVVRSVATAPSVPVAPPPPPPPRPSWQDIVNADPILRQDLADILGEGSADRGNVMGAMRQALVRYGGGNVLRNLVSSLGGDWGDLIDAATLGGADAADAAGTSLAAQLEKAHKDKMLAEADIRAAQGMTQSGQTGFEIGQERQRDAIAKSDAVGQLLSFLHEAMGGYAGREAQRNTRRSQARGAAGQRAIDLGLEPGGGGAAPAAPPPPPAYSFPVPPALRPRAPVVRPPRRPIGGWE